MKRASRTTIAATLTLAVGLLAACGGDAGSDTTASAVSSEVTVTNCGTQETFPSPARRIYVNDGNMTSMLLSIGAQDQIGTVVGLDRHREVLTEVYGEDVIEALPDAGEGTSISLEHVIAQKPDVVVAGWNYGYREENNLTPDGLKTHDIAPYVLSESCRQEGGARGTMPPWEALEVDITNLGEITGRVDEAKRVNDDIGARLKALQGAPQPKQAPTVFLLDSAHKDVLTSGSFGAPQAIIEAAGAKNATEDVKDTWTRVSWEHLVAADPDYFAFVDYPAQSYEDKVKALKTNPATKNLAAVKEERFLNLSYAAWTSSPLNIDAAEQLRAGLEEHDLVPDSDIEPEFDLEP